jgi:SAM-dependent methyltransferase
VNDATRRRPALSASEWALVARKRLALLVPPTRLLARWRRRPVLRLARRYLGGLHGLEIGGSSQNDFGVDVVNVDRYGEGDEHYRFYKQAEIDAWGYGRPVDVVARGHRLPFADDSYDFVLASHVIEHIPDPIAALCEWDRVARRYLFLVVPHRDRTFDRDRPLTPLDELVERHRSGFASDEDRHWSVWSAETFRELCEHLGFEVLESQEPDTRGGNGFLLILRARSRRRSPADPPPSPRPEPPRRARS